MDGTSRTELYCFASTPLNEFAFPARETAIWYARMWEIELTYTALKVTQRCVGRLLRSRGPRGMEQEVHACRTTRQLLGIFQGQAAAEGDVEPRRVPFTEVLPVVATHFTQAA
ncbi:hypothetical protein ACFYO0_11395 [Streptomyces sp. NPDC006365]|uniref:hypothetical protein n=1 Tax=Streptomyces sp. NPDC006365 TaxID=3364744 RepID=UPI00367B9644